MKTIARRLARTGVVKLWSEFDIMNGKGLGVTPAIKLNRDQKAALDPICSSLRGGGYRTFLIHGVTGSGKTEVYLRAIEEALSQGKGSLLLVPEIALTPAVAAQFFGRFGDKVAILPLESPKVYRWSVPAHAGVSPDFHFSFGSANHRVASDAFIDAGWKALKALRRSTPNG